MIIYINDIIIIISLINIYILYKIATFSAGCGAVMAGFFGMNVINGFEESNMAFYAVISGTGIGSVSLFYALYRFYKATRIL